MNWKQLGCIAAMALAVGGCKPGKGDKAAAGEALVVSAQKVAMVPVVKSISFSGNIEGNKTVRLGFMVAGKVNYIAAEEGQTIQSGQLLASLDPESYQIAKVMSDAQVDQLQDDYDRLKELYDRKSLSESDMVKITMGLRTAKAQQQLQAKNLADCKLYSPIRGVLLKRGVEVGEIIDKGLQLFAVSDIFTVKVVGSVPESDLRYMKEGHQADVFISSLDSTFSGQIIEIGSLADPATRTFAIKIALDNPQLRLRPGMTAEIKVNTGAEVPQIAIPANCVQRDPDNSTYVYIADTKANKAFKQLVSVGDITGNLVEITSGLAVDDFVITSGFTQLTNGLTISINQAQ